MAYNCFFDENCSVSKGLNAGPCWGVGFTLAGGTPSLSQSLFNGPNPDGPCERLPTCCTANDCVFTSCTELGPGSTDCLTAGYPYQYEWVTGGPSECVPTAPPPVTITTSAGMNGDPHVKTWTGEWFDFHGECDLVLLDAMVTQPELLPLLIHVRTTIRYEYSFIDSAALMIGGDILEVNSWGGYALNGISNADLDGEDAATLSDGLFAIHYSHPSDKVHKFDIVMSPTENITLSTYKDLVSVTVHGSTGTSFLDPKSVVGMMGSTAKNGTALQLLARDGVTDLSHDKNTFGQEWQVTEKEPKLFLTAREPQAPHEKCRFPDTSSSKSETERRRRRLGEKKVSRDDAADACSQYVGQSKQACIFDVLATDDVGIAETGGY